MAGRKGNYPPISGSVGTTNNPAGTVLADTGAISTGTGYGAVTGGGVYEILVTASGDASGTFTLQRRNAANGANVGTTFIFRCPANNTVGLVFRLEAESGERFRVICTGTGNFEATIIAQRMG